MGETRGVLTNHCAAAQEGSTTAALVTARDVGRTYRQGATSIVALAHATCTIWPGNRIALLGQSGSGKSTLLHLLGGLDTPTSGELSWPALGARAKLRPAQIAIVFQTPSLLPPLTVVENVELPLLIGGVAPAAARTAALETLEALALTGIAEQLPEELSGGQAQRVAVARALAYRPRLILADEPTGQLDHPTAQQLFDVMLAALDGIDTALVVATHDQTIAQRMSDVWRIEHGVLEGAAA